MGEMSKIVNIGALSRYNENIQRVIDEKVQNLITDTELKFFCIEHVTVSINGDNNTYDANTLVVGQSIYHHVHHQ